MRVDIAEIAPTVPPAAAIAWWTDFRSGRADHAFLPGARRRVERPADGTWTIVDEMRLLGLPVWRERYRVRALPDRVELFDATSWYATYTAAYVFSSVGGGTRVQLVADIRLRRPIGWTDPLARPLVRGLLRIDLRGHLRDMQRDLAAPA